MARNIKRIAHDLLPLSDAITELSSLVGELLYSVKPYAQFNNLKSANYFKECIKAIDKLAISAKLIREYIQEVNREADKEGISKD